MTSSSSTSAAGAKTDSYRYLGATQFGPYRQVLQFGSLSEIPSCDNDSNQVVIQVDHVELNPVDLQKLNPPPRVGQSVQNAPMVVGYGGSGVVVFKSTTTTTTRNDLQEGDSVIFLADPRRRGAFATHVVCDVACVYKYTALSSSSNLLLDSKLAATIPLAGCTALESLQKLSLDDYSSAETSSFSSLLIVGGAGGVGSWATRLIRALYPNVKVLCTASSKESQDWCIKNGASTVFPHDAILDNLQGGRQGSVDRVLCLTEPKPELWKALTEVIKPYGKICLVVAGKSIGSLDLGFLFFKSVTVLTETIFNSQRTGFDHVHPATLMKTIVGLIGQGKLEAPFAGVANWKTALEEGSIVDQIASGHTRGKLVMKVD